MRAVLAVGVLTLQASPRQEIAKEIARELVVEIASELADEIAATKQHVSAALTNALLTAVRATLRDHRQQAVYRLYASEAVCGCAEVKLHVTRYVLRLQPYTLRLNHTQLCVSWTSVMPITDRGGWDGAQRQHGPDNLRDHQRGATDAGAAPEAHGGNAEGNDGGRGYG